MRTIFGLLLCLIAVVAAACGTSDAPSKQATGSAGAGGGSTGLGKSGNGASSQSGGAASMPSAGQPLGCGAAAPYAYTARLNPVWQGSAQRIRSAGGLTFVGWESVLPRGVSIFDFSGAEPRELAFIPGSAVFDVQPGKLALKVGTGVELFNIAEDGAYELAGGWQYEAIGYGSSDDVLFVDEHLYVSISDFDTGSSKVTVLDVSDLAKPKTLSEFVVPGVSLVLRDSLLVAYGSDGDATSLFDVSDISQPKKLATIDDAGNSTESIVIQQDLMFVSRGLQDIWVYDISDPALPTKIAAIPPDTAYVRQLAVLDDVLYVLATAEVRVLNVRELDKPVELARFRTVGFVRDILLDAGRVLIADDGWFQIGFGSCLATVPAGGCEVAGDVVVNPNSSPGKKADYTVMTLAELEGVKCIGGTLRVRFTDSVAQLTSLETVGGLEIKDNPELVDLEGLEHLTHLGRPYLGGSLSITGNDELQDISALSGLSHVPFGIYIERNPKLETLAGLNGLLSAVDGFSSVGMINIQENTSLADVSALDQLRLFRGEEIQEG